MLYFNYQPISWENEWKIFKFNLKQLWAKRNKRMLDNRINRETYQICFYVYMAITFSIVPFFLGLTRSELLGENVALVSMLVCGCINFLFLLYALGKRLQDLGIPSVTVVLLLLFLAWYGNFFADPVFFDWKNPIAADLVGGGRGGFPTLNFPEFITWMTAVAIVALLLPANQRDNFYGKVPQEGITFFEKNFPEWKGRANYFSSSEDKEEQCKQSFTYFLLTTRMFIQDMLNFKGRMTLDCFKGWGGILVPLHWILAYIIFNFKSGVFSETTVTLFTIHFVVLVPTLSAYVRRLHDGYNSALWIPLTYIPLINIFVYLMLLVTPSWKPEDIKLEE